MSNIGLCIYFSVYFVNGKLIRNRLIHKNVWELWFFGKKIRKQCKHCICMYAQPCFQCMPHVVCCDFKVRSLLIARLLG